MDASGLLAGVNTSCLLRGASLAVPVETIVRVVEAIGKHGGVRRGYLGVATHPVRLLEPLAERLGLGQDSGLMVLGVEPDSPAAKAGWLMGDTLVSLGGEPVKNPRDLFLALEEEAIGREVKAILVRGGERRELSVTPVVRGQGR